MTDQEEMWFVNSKGYNAISVVMQKEGVDLKEAIHRVIERTFPNKSEEKKRALETAFMVLFIP